MLTITGTNFGTQASVLVPGARTREQTAHAPPHADRQRVVPNGSRARLRRKHPVHSTGGLPRRLSGAAEHRVQVPAGEGAARTLSVTQLGIDGSVRLAASAMATVAVADWRLAIAEPANSDGPRRLFVPRPRHCIRHALRAAHDRRVRWLAKPRAACWFFNAVIPPMTD